MPLDAICLRALVSELNHQLLGARIDKVHQPARDEVIISLRHAGGNARLLLSANPARPRLSLTTQSFENPAAPPMFCMLLRKHLSGGKIQSMIQPSMERVVLITIEAMDELGEYKEKRLIIETMGRHSNLILTDSENRIIDCLRRVDMEMSQSRQVLPGLFYRLPPPQKKQNPLMSTSEERQAAFAAAPPEKQLSQWLLDTYLGLSPLLCRELSYKVAGDTEARILHVSEDMFLSRFTQFLEDVNASRFTPFMLLQQGRPVDFSCFPIQQYGSSMEYQQMDSFSQLLDAFYALRETKERIALRGQDLKKTVTSARDRIARRLALQQKELAQAENRDMLREYGDLVTSNLHQMRKGMTVLQTVNYYDPAGAVVSIALDPLLTPQQNAARYYKKYQKAKNAAHYLTEQISQGQQELQYVDSVLDALSKAEREQDLLEIRQELLDNGYLNRRSHSRKEKRLSPSRPMEFRSTSGLSILVGKNNMQNDALTLKTALKSDLWLHVQKMPGSHVILRCEGQTPDAQSIFEAASLAAYYSSGREGQNVPVDYTQVRYVKKPSGARPGMVVYTPYQTAYVTPDETLPKRLLLSPEK